MRRTDQELSLVYFVTDLLSLNATLLTALTIYQGEINYQYDGLTMVALSLVWVMCCSLNNMYRLHLFNSFKTRFLHYLKSHIAFIGTISTIYLVFTLPNYIKAVMITFVLLFPILSLCLNFLMYKLIGKLKSNHKLVKTVVIAGSGKSAMDIFDYYTSNPDFGFHVVGCFDDVHPLAKQNERVVGELADLENLINEIHLDEIVIALSVEKPEQIRNIIEKANYNGIRVKVIPDYRSIIGEKYRMTKFGEVPVINVREISLDKFYLSLIKRVFDIVFSSLALLALIPIFIALAIAIKSDSRGPVFYNPVRIGRNGKRFRLFKFRSMEMSDDSSNGKRSTSKDDERITKMGRIIRKYSLDELPQFLNVLLGDMSVVGPRPHRVYLNEIMQKEVDNYMLRSYLKPGITGWAQVNGWRGPTDTDEQRQQRTAHDLWYMENWSLSLDAKIIYLTLFSQKTHQVAF